MLQFASSLSKSDRVRWHHSIKRCNRTQPTLLISVKLDKSNDKMKENTESMHANPMIELCCHILSKILVRNS